MGGGRAYWHFNNQWKHVHIIEKYIQTDLFGQDIEISRVKLTQHSREVYEVETSKLTTEKPRRARRLS